MAHLLDWEEGNNVSCSGLEQSTSIWHPVIYHLHRSAWTHQSTYSLSLTVQHHVTACVLHVSIRLLFITCFYDFFSLEYCIQYTLFLIYTCLIYHINLLQLISTTSWPVIISRVSRDWWVIRFCTYHCMLLMKQCWLQPCRGSQPLIDWS